MMSLRIAALAFAFHFSPAVTSAQSLFFMTGDDGLPSAACYAGAPDWLVSQKDPRSHWHAMRTLEAVDLYLHDITLPEIRYVVSLTQVRHLTLGHAPERVGLDPGVLAAVARSRHIEGLSICKSNLRNADCDTLSAMRNLKDLIIEGEDLCEATDPHGLTAEAVDSLAKLKSLESLEIRGDARFTDQSVETLATLPRLRSLRLRSRHLTDKALEIAASRMTLSRLDLESPHFTRDAIAKLRESQRIEKVHIGLYRPWP